MRSMAAVDIAIMLIRPDAKYQLENVTFTKWDDPRPIPTWEEINETIEKIKNFEQSLNIIYLEDYKQ